MKVSEIIESVDIQVPNSIPITEKIKWLNQIHNQLYRDYPFPDGIMAFNITVDQPFYALPNNCVEGRINSLVVDDEEVRYVPGSETAGQNENYWSIVDNAIFINPTPTAANVAYLYYRKSPTQLTVADMTTVPDLPVDFHEIYVLGCCARVARTSPETVGMAASYQSEYLRLADRADVLLRKKPQRSVRIVREFI